MTDTIHFVLNTQARRFASDPSLIARIEALARGRATVWVTHDLDELGRAAREIKRRQPGLVALCGGDGTFMAGVTALERADPGEKLPRLALVPAGTVATVARNWGERGDVLTTVQRLLQQPEHRFVQRATLSVREIDSEPRTGFTVGTGLVARFFDRYYSAGGRGYRTALGIVGRVFLGSFVGNAYAQSVLTPLPCSLTVDGVTLPPRAYSLVVCSVLKDLGLHIRVTHRGGENAQRPHLVASPLSTRQLGPQAPRVLLGRPLTGAGTFDGLVEEFTLRFPGGEAGPYVLDGDIFRARAVSVRAGPTISVLTLARH